MRCHKKKTRPQFSILRSVTESAWAQYGWFHADSVTELKIENCGRVFFLWHRVISMTDQFFRTHPSLTAYSSRSKPHTPNKLHIFGKLWTWAFAWSYPGFFSLSKFRGMSVLWKNSVFSNFSWPHQNKFQGPADRTILKFDALPIAHFEDDVPNFSKHLWKLAIPLKLWVPAASEVRWSRNVTNKKPHFRVLFWIKHFFQPNWAKKHPQVLYMVGKLRICSLWWKTKKLFSKSYKPSEFC